MSVAAPVVAPVVAPASIPSSPDLGVAEGRCRPGESGPAFIVDVVGLKDRTGNLKLEVYPATKQNFLADDNVLVAAGKTFRRVVAPLPPSGPVSLCVRTPGPGTYAVSLLHDRNSNRRFNWTVDGIGFSSNPRLGWSKPSASSVRTTAGSVPVRLSIVLNYRQGMGMSPLGKGK